MFHGSLGNAAAIAERLDWLPGSFCKTAAFYCSAWYNAARPWLLHQDWRILPAEQFAAHAPAICTELGCRDRVFVRPDSPLKPFAVDVLLNVDDVTLDWLDYGFYYDDATLPIVVAPVQSVGSEWRFVVVRSHVLLRAVRMTRQRVRLFDTPASEAWGFWQT